MFVMVQVPSLYCWGTLDDELEDEELEDELEEIDDELLLDDELDEDDELLELTGLHCGRGLQSYTTTSYPAYETLPPQISA